MAKDNTDRLCATCRAKANDDLVRPPTLPLSFWADTHMATALDSWHMGKVLLAYRTHPSHGRTISQETVAGWLDLTQAQLSRIENGRAPEELSKLIHWANTLGVPSDLLWFKLPQDRVVRVGSLPQPRKVRDEPVERRNFIGIGAGLAAAKTASAVDFLTALRPAEAPTIVRREDIEQVQRAAQLFTTWDHTYGGGIVREAVIAQLRWSALLLKIECPKSLRPHLFTAVGSLSSVCGFMAFDAFAHHEGQQMFTFGLSCAEEGGAWHLRAKLLSNLARQAIWCGDADTGLTYTELALVRPDRLTATEQAMLHTARARALGKLGQVQQTLEAIGAADDAFARANPSDDPPWMTYYDHAQHHGDTGHALFDLAMRGACQSKAVQRLHTAVEGHTDGYARSRAISGTKLATVTMATGDPREAVAIGNRALDDAGHLRSRRTISDLHELRRTAQRHVAIPEVAELRNRISTVEEAQ